MEMLPPAVSVIIPTYNWSSALRFSISSVLWQTFRDFELLVVGDGCTDDSAEVVASFADPRVRWHNLSENTGNQPAPNNAGIAMARGKYIAYLGHDDLWLPDHLERLVAAMESSGADVGYSWVELIGPDPAQVRMICGITASGEYETGMGLVPSGIMHLRAMVEEIGPWRDHRTIITAPDREFLERAVRAGKKFTPVRRLTALKFNASWRPDCYIEKPVHQQAEYSRRIRESANFVADEMHDIVEFLVRKIPGELARWNPMPEHTREGLFIEHTRQLRGLNPMPIAPVPAPAEYPPLIDWIDFGKPESARFLWHGWGGQEEGFRWTDGGEAQFVFGLKRISGLQMLVHCAPLLIWEKVESQRVIISCNGVETGSWNLTNREMETFQADLDEKLLRPQNVITFHLPDAVVPVRVLQSSTDTRQLGIRVARIEFKRPA